MARWAVCDLTAAETDQTDPVSDRTLSAFAGELQMTAISDIVDTHRYPLDQPGGERLSEVLDGLRRNLRRDGCAVLKGFVHDEGLAKLVSEADRVAPQAHRSHEYNHTASPITPLERAGLQLGSHRKTESSDRPG